MARGLARSAGTLPHIMEDNMNEIVQMISTLGFPIAMALLLFWKMDKQDASHQEEVDKMTQALNQNTLVIQQLVDKLDT